ncbi:hypothetical protein ACHQM5_013008 [Ranunculus cassubicifolius]
MGLRECLWDVLPFIAMLTVECTDVGLTTLSKAAMSKGMSPFVYVVYYNALGTLILFPSFLLQRKKHPPLTFSLLCIFFLLGLIGITFGQILAFTGIRYSSPTLLSAMDNLIPAFTFLLAIVFRMEILDMRKSSSQAKFMGTIVSLSGAFIVTLYKGPPIVIIPSNSNLHNQLSLTSQSNWVFGGLLLALSGLMSAMWKILQAGIMKAYPAEMTIIFFYCLFGTIQCAIFSFFAEKDSNAWKIKPGLELGAFVYSAIFGSIYHNSVHTWGIHKKGPVYVSMFRPLGIIIAVAMGVTFLKDTLHIGSVIGATVIALGFYAVMWGKAKEEKMVPNNNEVLGSESPAETVPLLANNMTNP